ncbi:hypothetical protein EUGRSUZ_D01062 [Eucalyptus grandis]|uniref:Uncharacterized protein n=1 Tax=Eucalyptus grandis TaxID=71139 RepID=A0A059CE98_EUCGR|nr:hypothetical protein EUGRSUZ_D01062 [Eucalyptus grandis]
MSELFSPSFPDPEIDGAIFERFDGWVVSWGRNWSSVEVSPWVAAKRASATHIRNFSEKGFRIHYGRLFACRRDEIWEAAW